MVERARRLRMGLAHSSPGASGDTARPNYVGPSGNGLVKRMNAGTKSPAGSGRSRERLLPFQKAVPRSKEKPRWGAERRAGTRYGPAIPFAAGWAKPQG